MPATNRPASPAQLHRNWLALVDSDGPFLAVPPLLARDGVLRAGRIATEPARLAEVAASEDRTEWWLARLSRCHELLLAREG